MTERERDKNNSMWSDGERDGYICWNQCDGPTDIRDRKYRSAALGLWEGLSHSALLRSIVIVLKCHSALLRLIVIVFKLVGAKNNWL